MTGDAEGDRAEAMVDRLARDLAAGQGRSTASADDRACVREMIVLRELFPLVCDQMERKEVPRKIHGRPVHKVLTSNGAGPRTVLERSGREWVMVDPDGEADA